MTWEPDQYERFKAERRQPFLDLMALVEPRPKMHVVDLGCGTGELTRELHDHLNAEETMGIDNSETMLLKSGTFANQVLRFSQGDIEAFVTDRPFDMVFSNAALHWVPDHERLFARLVSFLTPRGQIAIQMPANDDHPTHRTAADIAKQLGIEPRQDHILPLEKYSSLLHHLGFKRQHVRMQIYGHELPASSDVVEWVRGALLIDYEARLGARYAEFLDQYTKELMKRIGDHTPYFYTYKRILIWATF